MVSQDSLLATLVKLVDCLPMTALLSKRECGHPKGSIPLRYPSFAQMSGRIHPGERGLQNEQ